MSFWERRIRLWLSKSKNSPTVESLYQAFKERLIEELPTIAARQMFAQARAEQRADQLKPCQWCGRDQDDHMSDCPNGTAR